MKENVFDEKTCPVCGRKYQRETCPFCRREKMWKSLSLEKQLPHLTPRMYQVFNSCTTFQHKLILENCFCHGLPGSGKTIYAIKLLHSAMHNLFINNQVQESAILKMYDFQNELLQAKNNFEIINKYKKVKWLVIDDLGAHKDNAWLYQNLYSIIDYRYEYLLPLIITSNKSLRELSEITQDFRISRRIASMCKQLKFNRVYGTKI